MPMYVHRAGARHGTLGTFHVVAAYVISEVEPLDEDQFRTYRELAAASIARHGGRYIVRGAEPEIAEGEPAGKGRIVIVEFSDREALRRWYGSADYAEALVVRDRALRRRLLFVDGVDDILDISA
jgi:uncharacterized protein (DUF1330 family)